MTVSSERMTIDLLDPALYQRNPHDVWSWMRANEPVYRDEKNGLWGISRHADVMDVERRSMVFSSAGVYRAVFSPGESNMIAQDDPRHRQQRMLVQPQLTRAGVATRTEEIRSLVAELVDEAIEKGHFEVVDMIAGQLPARLTSRLLGFPEEMWPHLKSWSERLMRTDMRERDPEVMAEFIEANREFIGAMTPIIGEVAACPRNDFMSIWTHARIDGKPLPPESIVHEVGLFIAGGAETTRTAISHGLRAFCDHQDQWEELAKNPELADSAVEEVLRWVTPLNNFSAWHSPTMSLVVNLFAPETESLCCIPLLIEMKQCLTNHLNLIFTVIPTRICRSDLEHICALAPTWRALCSQRCSPNLHRRQKTSPQFPSQTWRPIFLRGQSSHSRSVLPRVRRLTFCCSCS